ncbi:MAG: hypothetical protein NTV49_00060 [Kiritimatiellaeota bacterium]|nr:hypothetical protein [Kiritimatiellota bacterium]
MAKKPHSTKTVETLKHDADKRKNIPTAEHQSVLQKEQEAPRSVTPDFPAADLEGIKLPTGARIACDTDGHACVLFGNDWSVRYFGEINAQLALEPLPPEREDICCLTGTSNG